MAVYFRGRRKIGEFLLSPDRGNATLECKIFERWEDIDCSTTARCGAEGECQVSKTEGVSKKTVRTIEDVVESSIGIKDFAELKIQIKDILGKEVNWSHSTTTTKTFPYKAPQCGRCTLVIYQLVREFELAYKRKRLFGADEKWDRLIREDTNCHDALPDVQEFDEICKCQKQNNRKYDGRLCFDLGDGSFRVPYSLTGDGFDVQIVDKVISFMFDNYSAGMRGFDQGFSISLPVDVVPAPLIFLSDIQDEMVEARVSVFKESDEYPMFEESMVQTSIVKLPNIFLEGSASYIEAES